MATVEKWAERKPVTTGDLIEFLQQFPPDTPVFDGRGFDLRWTSIDKRNYDDWDHTTTSKDEDGHVYETPGVAVGVSIGPKF